MNRDDLDAARTIVAAVVYGALFWAFLAWVLWMLGAFQFAVRLVHG